jgi:predicted O-linked N-acetylglucosamine transferase (SPINDLY family)
MGVPVVTVTGASHVARVGASLLTHCGLTDLIASDEAGYVATAVKLAGDADRLADLRRTMRDRLNAAPLTDYKGFAREVETAYRAMWHDWVARAAA